MATAVSTNDERHACSLIVAFEFYPQMAIKMIHKCPSNIVLMMIQNDPNNKFMKSLNDSETKLIPTLSTDGFNKLDMSLLYKLIRRFNLVPEPSEKWGNRPLATNINQGDDMERMRFNRNDLVHRPRGGLSEEERDTFLKESIEIARRVDNFIGDSTSSFETGIRNVEIHHITQEKYRQVLEKCVELQQQLKDIPGITRVDLYYGDDIAVKLGHATDSIPCTIYIRDPNMNVPIIVEQLEQAKKRLNEGSYDVILLDAESGSLVLHVEIHNRCFITKDSLHKAIAEFLRRVFTSISGSLDQHIMEVVLAECDSYIISDNEEKNYEYLNDQEPSILKLDVMVSNTSLQSKTDLYRDVHGFISKVLDVTDKNVESTNGSPLAVIMTSQHVDGMSLNTRCDPCTRIDENVPASKWCIDCGDALCITCVKSHKGSKVSMTHLVIDMEVKSTLPDEVLTPQTKCSKHPDFIMDFFCNQHHVICCRSCMSEDHRSCDKVMALEMASNDAKTSSLFHDISQGMKQVHLRLKTAVQNRRENRDRVKIEEKTIVRQISAFKSSVIKRLDELEKSALLEMQTVSQDSISQMEREESELEKSVILIEKHLQQLDFFTKNGSNKHVFLLLHRLLPILSKEDNHLEEIVVNLSDVSLVYDQPENVLSGVEHLGTIRLKKEPCAIRFKHFKHMEAQEISVQSKPPKSFKFSYRIDRKFDNVTGMVVDKDDNLILADQSYLLMYSKDMKYVKDCKLGGISWDISYHKKSGRIVVALKDNGIQFVDNIVAQRKIIVKNMTTCFGVTWVDDNVYVSGCDDSKGKGKGRIHILDSNGQHVSSVSSIGTVYYIHHRDNNIYYTDLNNVYCIKKDGSNVFTSSFPYLEVADGIDTDRQGNAYVVGRGSNNILRLSPDGQNSDIIMKKEDGISSPFTLCFTRDFKKLFVSNKNGKRVVVYDCEY